MVRFARLMARGFCTSEQFRLGVVKVKRRDLIVIFGGAVVSRSISARAQPVKRWRIGFLSGTSAPAIEPSLKAFRQGLRAFGYATKKSRSRLVMPTEILSAFQISLPSWCGSHRTSFSPYRPRR
jgi:hypothetical protein